MTRRTLLMIGLCIFSLSISAAAPHLSYCQQETKQVQYLEANGNVSEIDVIAGKIALNTKNGIMVFLVTPKTKIMAGTEAISIENVGMNDYLSVTYYVDKDGSYQAVSIMDSNLSGEIM